jgi:hypothetical protein
MSSRAPIPALPSVHQEYRKGRLAQCKMCEPTPGWSAPPRVLEARRTDVGSPPRPSQRAIASQRVRGLSSRGVAPTTVVTSHTELEPILGTNHHRGSSRGVPVALTLPAARLADNGLASAPP